MRLVSRILAAIALGVSGLLVGLGITVPWSRSGWFAIGCLAVAGVGLAIREKKPKRGLLLVAGLLLAVVIATRLVGAGDGMLSMRILPRQEPSRWLSRIVDEQDIAQLRFRLLPGRLGIDTSQRDVLLPALHAAYVDMHREQPYFASPVLDTLTGRQTPEAFDTLIIEPRAEPKPNVPMKFGVVSLHGPGGNSTLECWLLATAARGVGAVTVCPAIAADDWTSDAARRILGTTLEYLHGRGIKRIFLVGSGSDAAAAAALASRLGRPLEGLVVVSGAADASAAAGLPTLRLDNLNASDFPNARWLLLTQRESTQRAILDWLMTRTGYHVAR